MPSVSEQLRAAREDHGLTVYEVAEITKIRTDHIRALEEGDYETFAATVYVRGFVRTYARLLRLDVESLVAGLEIELGQTEKFRDANSSLGRKRGVLDLLMLRLTRVRWRWVLPGLGLVAIALAVSYGYRTWRDHEPKDPLADLGAGYYQPPPTGDVLPLPPTDNPPR